jgi:hypothetical protein
MTKSSQQENSYCRQCFGLRSTTTRTLRLSAIICITTQLFYFFAFENRILSSLSDHRHLEDAAVPARIIEPSQYLIDQARRRASEYRAMIVDKNEHDKKLAIQHPAFKNIPLNFQPHESWSRKYHPDIAIIGIPKAGTSQLYNILTGHPDLARFHPTEKEYCFDFGGAVNANAPIEHLQRSFYNATKLLDMETLQLSSSFGRPKKTVNACLDLNKAMLMRQYLGRSNDTKLILILRDPAEWLWSGFNFWHRPKYHDAINAVDYGWANPPEQYRSPELFHEMLLAGDRFLPSVDLLTYFRDILNGNRIRVAAEVEKANPGSILILKSEDMSPEKVQSSGFLDKVSDFLNVTQVGFNQSTYGSFSNCGNGRGLNNLCKKTSSAYAVAGGRTMLEESRELVYLHFAEECKFWADHFGVVYEACLAVREKYHLDD